MIRFGAADKFKLQYILLARRKRKIHWNKRVNESRKVSLFSSQILIFVCLGHSS